MHFAHTFEPEPASVRMVRSFVRSSVTPFVPGGQSAAVDDAVLLASELASNVVDHAGTPYRVAVDVTADRARVEIHDDAAGRPTAPELFSGGHERGRGLQILAAVALDWGVVERSPGKAVWFTVGLGLGPGPGSEVPEAPERD